MTAIGTVVARNATLSVGLADALCADIPADRFAAFAEVNGQRIEANHAAFNLGHLAIYPARVLGMLGCDPAPAQTPEHWGELFAAGVECKHDPDNTIYPSRDEVVGGFKRSMQALIDAAPGVSDEVYAGPNPAEGRFAEMLPTLGMAADFLAGSHCMMHLGQISTWRRCMGLGPAKM